MLQFYKLFILLEILALKNAIVPSSAVPFKIQSNSLEGDGVTGCTNCSHSSTLMKKSYFQVYCMGDLIRSWCAPICQERCENSMIIKDEYCFSTMCRFGCMCPPDRPLRNGLKCISRADCLPKPTCPNNMKFVSCVPVCQRTCDNLDEDFNSVRCQQQNCAVGCICSDNKVLKDGVCVPITDCVSSRGLGNSNKAECGYQFYQPNTRIVGGKTAIKGSWPWTVQLIKGVFDSLKLQCSGAILCSKWILTAAHCFDNTNGFYMDLNLQLYHVIVGKHLKSGAFEVSSQKRGLNRIIIHPNYNLVTKVNDIALIKVTQEMMISNHVRPVCLPPYHPPSPYNTWGPHLGTLCYVVGWGETKGLGPSNDKLKQAELTIRTASACKRLFVDFKTTTMLCAGGKRKNDACAGDSGGGLFCQHNGRWFVDGVISYGANCGIIGEPGVYTKTTAYSKWIKENIDWDCGDAI